MAALLVVKSVTLVRAAVPGGGSGAGAVMPAARAEVAPKAVVSVEPPGKAETPRAGAPSPPPPGPLPQDSGAAQVSESERTLLLDLRKRRGELDARDAALAAREAVLSAAEKRLGTRLDELTALQGRLEALDSARKDRDEASWRGLVKLYETMKPRDAAAIFNDLDLPVLLQVVDRMKETKAAPVLAAMLPERARQLTAELARLRARANAVAPSPADPPPAVAMPGSRPPTGSGVGAAAGPGSVPPASASNGKGKT